MHISKKKHTVFIIVWIALLAITLTAAFLTAGGGDKESIKAVMRDAVLHGDNKISLLGIKNVNPAIISATTVSCVLLLFAANIRIFVIPRFKMVPSKFQLLLEELVGFFDNLAKTNSPHRYTFLGGYVFAASVYIYIGTLFELFGFQAITVGGLSVVLPAPLSDINAAIALGCLSYLVIMSGGIAGNGVKGIGLTLKDFSLSISMSFRLFGALLSGLLVKIENNEVLVLVDSAERPEDIDALKAKQAADAAKEAILQKQSIREYHTAQMTLARAVARLRVKNSSEQ